MKITSRVIDILKELSGKEDIQITDDLQTVVCLDSLELVQLLIEIENEFEIILNESDLNPFDLETVKDESVPNQSQYFLANKAKKGNGQGDEVSKKGEPAYTIRANAKSRIHFHYSLNRRLTVRECARIQTFPDDFTFKHSKTTSIMQIGNAVPPMLAHAVGKSIANYCNKKEFKEALRNE